MNMIYGEYLFTNIRDNLDNLKILDARSPGEYDGTTVRAAQTGHIPNSINIDWNQNLNEDGTFKNDDELSQMYDIPKGTYQGFDLSSNTEPPSNPLSPNFQLLLLAPPGLGCGAGCTGPYW